MLSEDGPGISTNAAGSSATSVLEALEYLTSGLACSQEYGVQLFAFIYQAPHSEPIGILPSAEDGLTREMGGSSASWLLTLKSLAG